MNTRLRSKRVILGVALAVVLLMVGLLVLLHDSEGDSEPGDSFVPTSTDQVGASSPRLKGSAAAHQPTTEPLGAVDTTTVAVFQADGSPAKKAVVTIHQARSERQTDGGVCTGVAFVTGDDGRVEMPVRLIDDLGAVVADAVHPSSGEVSERSVGIVRDGPNVLHLVRGIHILGHVVGVPASWSSQVEVLAYGESWAEFPGLRSIAVAQDLTFSLLVPPGYMSLQAVGPGLIPSTLWKATLDGSTSEESVTLTVGGPGVEGRFKIVLGGPEGPMTPMPPGSVVLVGAVGRGGKPYVLGKDEWLTVRSLEAGKDAWIHVVRTRAAGTWETTSTIVRVAPDSWRRGAVIHVQRAARARFRVTSEQGKPLVAFPLLVRQRPRKTKGDAGVGRTTRGRTDEQGMWRPFAAHAVPVGEYEVRDDTGTLLWEGEVGSDDRTVALTSASLPLRVHLLSAAGLPLKTSNVLLQFASDADAEPSTLWRASFKDASELVVWYPRKNALTLVVTERWIRTQRIAISEFMGLPDLEVRTSEDAARAEIAVRYEGKALAAGRLTLIRTAPVHDGIYMVPVIGGQARLEGAAEGKYKVSAESANHAPLKVLSSRTVELLRGASVRLKIVLASGRGR